MEMEKGLNRGLWIGLGFGEGLNSDLSKSCSPETGSHESRVQRGVGYQQLAGKDLVKRPLRHELQTLSGYYP